MDRKHKRREEEDSDALQPTKRFHSSVTEPAKCKYFVVRCKHDGVSCIFENYERCKPYLSRKEVSIRTFDTRKDAEHFMKSSIPEDSGAERISCCKPEEVVNDTTQVEASVPNVVHAVQSDDQICKGSPVQGSTSRLHLPDSVHMESCTRVTVYANGTTSRPRAEHPKMAFGVYFEDNSPHNYAGCVGGSVSSQRADLKAALEAIKIIYQHRIVAPDGDVDLGVNSNYVKKGLEGWMKRWKQENWTNANRGPIKNVDLWQEMDSILAELEQMRVRVNVIIASGSPGSFSAGRLAEQARRNEEH